MMYHSPSNCEYWQHTRRCVQVTEWVWDSSPAVHHQGPSVWRMTGLDSAQEGQCSGGILWHSVVRPGHELELSNFSLLIGAVLFNSTQEWAKERRFHFDNFQPNTAEMQRSLQKVTKCLMVNGDSFSGIFPMVILDNLIVKLLVLVNKIKVF